MKHLKLGIVILVICGLFTACQPRELGTQAIVDMLEVNATTGKVEAMVEYRILGEKDSPITYDVYKGEGDTLWQALGDIESNNLITLYMDNCKIVNIVAEDNESLEKMILQVDQLGSIRPRAWVTTAEEPLLEEGEAKDNAVYKEVGRIFFTNGGTLGNRFTLKDSVVSQKEKDIPLILPVIEDNKVKEIKIWKNKEATTMDIDKAKLLPIPDILIGKWRVYLEENECEIFLDNLYLVNWVEITENETMVHLDIMPTYSIVNGNQYDLASVEKELYTMVQTAVEESMTEVVIPMNLDLYSIKRSLKTMGIPEQELSQIKYKIKVENFF